ncbi:hypothetical protein CKO15_09110 [Halorhodospira abdelmalekii]|nr:class I SAM-dependent methyltransferase [Halorhodospira abdelmalekii]MBK1735438.1 hypothetical protein [Halorhodospira abdelmalekii]
MSSDVELGIRWYDERASDIAEQYCRVGFADVHGWLMEWLPPVESSPLVLDVGSGSGRDAAWFAERGYRVVAVEPASALRDEARRLHPSPCITWLDDKLPELGAVGEMGTAFDLILLSAVWMHVPKAQRSTAFRRLRLLLSPGGLMAVTLRLGPPDVERGMHAVSVQEIRFLAGLFGADVEHVGYSPDALGRSEVSWAEVLIRG